MDFKAYAYDSVAGSSLRISFSKEYLVHYKITRIKLNTDINDNNTIWFLIHMVIVNLVNSAQHPAVFFNLSNSLNLQLDMFA